MFKNYFTVAFRSFRRNKFFSLINIAGLAIGISAALVIYLIVSYEFSFEKFQPNKERRYRIVTNMHFPDQDFKNSGVPGPLPEEVIREIPGIEKSTRFWMSGRMKVTVNNAGKEPKIFRKQDKVAMADDRYFSFFPYKWLAGSPSGALSRANEVVLTESRAKAYFPGNDLSRVIGKVIVYDDTVNATVTGVVKDPEEITDFTSKEFISLPTYEKQFKQKNGWDQWGSVNSASQFFVQLKKGVDSSNVNKALVAVRKKHEKEAYLKTSHYLQALTDIHFNSDYGGLGSRVSHKPTLYGLLAVASFLLLLGCINFINLTTAQAAQRAKEIGIRKTMGGSKASLVFQFLSETFVLTLVATLLSLALTPLILKAFSDYIPEGLTFAMAAKAHVVAFIVLLVLVVTVLSGFYPALILSGFKPVTVLKNVAFAGTTQSRSVWIRKTLTVSQFVIAQFFIIATFVVGKQIRFSLDKDLGFKKDAIITFNTPFHYFKPDNKQFVLQQQLKGIPGIYQMSLAGDPPASDNTSSTTMKFKKDGKEIETTVEVKEADTSYFNLYHMKLLAGRNLQQSDTTKEYVINEAYAKFLGYRNPADIVGKLIDPDGRKLPIVGVLADFNNRSVHQVINPLAYSSQQKYHSTFHIALAPGSAESWTTTINRIKDRWKSVYPEEEFDYSFFDKQIAQFYETEQKTSSLLKWCTGLAIFISCLGLLGLVTYTTHQRTKEIGVRKVLGASVVQIVSLLSKDFIRLILVAFVIATPLAWWAMHNWLNDFAYRTALSWWIFALCGVTIILVALLIIAAKTLGAAMDNPVKSLRTE